MTTPMTRSPAVGTLDALRRMRNTMSAVMLRDMRSRFFNHGLGFLMVALWPLAHMGILLTIYTTLGRRAPFGESTAVFFATGLVPTLLFMYVSRFMALSLIQNRSMLGFPAVRTMDIIFARAILETIAAFLTLVFLVVILVVLGNNPVPYNFFEATYAYLSVLLLAIGVGVIVSVVAMFAPFFVTIYTLSTILIYLLSGTLFVVSELPDAIAGPLAWNPVLHGVEWMRTAYYEGYSDKWLNKSYLIGFGLGALCTGLAAERLLRRRMLDS